MQVALYRAHGHFQDLRNFRRVQIFLIAQDHDGAGFLRQLPDQLAQPFAEQEVGLTGIARRFRDAVEPDLRAQIPLAYLIDRSMADGAAQPPRGVGRAFDAGQLPVKLQENVLRQFFRALAVAQVAQGDAEDHRLVLFDNSGELEPHTSYYGSEGREIATQAQRPKKLSTNTSKPGAKGLVKRSPWPKSRIPSVVRTRTRRSFE